MVFVTIDGSVSSHLAGAELVTLRNADSKVVVARMIGPVAGEAPEAETWRVDAMLAVDPRGAPLSSMINPVPASDGAQAGEHDWGALGLPDGLATGMRPAGEPDGSDELTLARGSSGHRQGQELLLLRLAPGDTVRVAGESAIVLAVDRRKRTVEIDADGEVRLVAFDDVEIEETS